MTGLSEHLRFIRYRVGLIPIILVWLGLPLISFRSFGQAAPEIAFISDTQAPTWIEKIFLVYNQNERATELLFADIQSKKPEALFILGDVVSLGCQEKKWSNVDRYLLNLRKEGVPVSALLGNHDVMRNGKKGIRNFEKRFLDHVRTGYFQIVDSIAVVMLNSNFKKMSASEISQEVKWYQAALQGLDGNPAVRVVLVTCHHAPYTLSKIVRPSEKVQQYFVPPFLESKKCRLFITGHAHAFEHFVMGGKDFLTIGGGGGLHQPLKPSGDKLKDMAPEYKPMFHYLKIHRIEGALSVNSRFLLEDFSRLEDGNSFNIKIP